MPLFDIFTKLFSGGAGDLVTSIGNVADKFITTKAEKESFNQQIQVEVNRHNEAIATAVQKEFDTTLADLANARALQITALQQNDNFSKRFVYYLASFFIFLVMSFNFCLFFFEFPGNNRDIIMSLVGVLNGSGIVMILTFFFGSSSASKQKEDTIRVLHETIASGQLKIDAGQLKIDKLKDVPTNTDAVMKKADVIISAVKKVPDQVVEKLDDR